MSAAAARGHFTLVGEHLATGGASAPKNSPAAVSSPPRLLLLRTRLPRARAELPQQSRDRGPRGRPPNSVPGVISGSPRCPRCSPRRSERSARRLRNRGVRLSERHPGSRPSKLCSGWVQATDTAPCCSREQELCCFCLLQGAGAVLLLAASGRGPRRSQKSTRAGRMEPGQHHRAVSPCDGAEPLAVLPQVWCKTGMLDTILALGLMLRQVTKPAVG